MKNYDKKNKQALSFQENGQLAEVVGNYFFDKFKKSKDKIVTENP